MATKSTGVNQKDNGYWEYRFVMVVDGKQINKQKSTDAFGNKLKTNKEAIEAREAVQVQGRHKKIVQELSTKRKKRSGMHRSPTLFYQSVHSFV